MKKFGLILCVALAAVACGNSGASSEPGTITMATTATADYVALSYGMQQGIFKDDGITVDAINISGQGPALTALLAGSVNVVQQSPVLAAVAKEQGSDVRIFCGAIPVMWTTMYARSGVDVKTVAEAGSWEKAAQSWAGKTMGVPVLNSSTQAAAEGVLTSAGVSPSDVTFVAVGVGASAVSALSSGSVDLLMSFPFQSELIDDGSAKVVFDFNADAPAELSKQASSGLMATKSWLDDNADLATNFCASMQSSMDAVLEAGNADTVRGILKADYGLTDEASLDRAMRDGGPLSIPSTKLDCGSIENNLRLSKERDAIKPDTSISCDDYFWTAG